MKFLTFIICFIIGAIITAVCAAFTLVPTALLVCGLVFNIPGLWIAGTVLFSIAAFFGGIYMGCKVLEDL